MNVSRLAAAAGLLALAACAGRTMHFTSPYITGQEIREKGAETAYDVLASHREMIVTGSEIRFRGGFDLDGDNWAYTTPMLVVDGNLDVGDATTVLRRIRAEEITLIRLVYASEVPPRDRRPEAIGGIIEVTTMQATSRREH